MAEVQYAPGATIFVPSDANGWEAMTVDSCKGFGEAATIRAHQTAASARGGSSLAQLLHGAHFLDVDVELLRLLSRTLCTGHLAGKSGPELGRLLGVVSDFPTEAERQAATEEPLYTQDTQDDATAPRASDAPTPPVCWLSTQLVNEDALEDALADADVPTLRAL
ncbi:hypothetical protein Ctob_015716, partial [Chrysochromulina tobinii]